jgi:nucleoside-triphosphatase
MKILLTGRPGSGKSSLVKDLIKSLKGKNIAGIISPEIRNKERKGFKIIDLASGKEEILASADIKGEPRVSKYGVNIEGVDKIVGLFLDSFKKADYIFIDEIGKMELYSKKFKEMVDKIFKSKKMIIAVVHRNLANKYKDKGELIWVEREKIDQIKKEVLGKIR